MSWALLWRDIANTKFLKKQQTSLHLRGFQHDTLKFAIEREQPGYLPNPNLKLMGHFKANGSFTSYGYSMNYPTQQDQAS